MCENVKRVKTIAAASYTFFPASCFGFRKRAVLENSLSIDIAARKPRTTTNGTAGLRTLGTVRPLS
jgi:hypothetical protein